MAMSPRQLVPRSPWKAMAEAWLGLGGVRVTVRAGVRVRVGVRVGVWV